MRIDPEKEAYRGLTIVVCGILVIGIIFAVPWYIGWARHVVASFDPSCGYHP